MLDVVRRTLTDYSTEIAGTSDAVLGAWGQASGRVAKQIEAWVEQNRAKLLERRQAK